MLPAISLLINVEVSRDGGSLHASFQGANGSHYCLWFQIINSGPSPDNLGCSCFEAPVVFERIEVRSPDRFEWHSANEVELSWAHARVLLHQFHGFPLRPDQAHCLRIMEKVAALAGRLPHERGAQYRGDA